NAHDDCVPPSAEITGAGAQDEADAHAYGDGDKADEEGDAGAVEYPQGNIASELIGSHPVIPTGGLKSTFEVLIRNDGQGRYPDGCYSCQSEEDDNGQANDGGFVALEFDPYCFKTK